MVRFWRKLNEVYGRLVILAFAFVMVIGIWQVYDNYWLFNHTIDDSILKYKPDPSTPVYEGDPPITKEMVGWITIDDTNIDYPVMQGDDNVYFLNIDPFGEYSLSGSIFLDSRSSSDFSDRYSLIYGHHMDYGAMFGALDDFLDKSYLEKHITGTLMVGRNAEKIYDLEVFASMVVSAKEGVVFDLQEDRIEEFIHKNARVLVNESSGEDILALSTCADANTFDRIVVFCYKR